MILTESRVKWIEENQTGLTAAMLTLGPLLLAQGVYVRRTALKLPEPPGPREGVSGAGAPFSLLVAGDSAGAGVGSPTHDAALIGHIRAALSAGYPPGSTNSIGLRRCYVRSFRRGRSSSADWPVCRTSRPSPSLWPGTWGRGPACSIARFSNGSRRKPTATSSPWTHASSPR